MWDIPISRNPNSVETIHVLSQLAGGMRMRVTDIDFDRSSAMIEELLSHGRAICAECLIKVLAGRAQTDEVTAREILRNTRTWGKKGILARCYVCLTISETFREEKVC